ncbi:HAUS augmin-like complex subunit 3 [Callorhinchus milii]|uniref:HAUS augmin-like complex subunit 3 n=1 Tax=Callorhinchus milii TaxID=7868 RepID=V9KG61_CALMI|nr:HAUS augmin-like complex subunit 3 [Callorhinchus milii]XP_042199017.1 HAUS augmin-like complex subunit 3 [Callorhinchus milii]XP_042199038.1 HAUS augmin-like complex subunit 3 [Callorhinchus milii]XP_042199042.1 HAUS augmin-like complex subunit 3 [Callorhinchus milii]|eukprot:gi/632973988/ref/XP_007903424.1/ PREDICTED: HAUS augmin-like complex subunit 3 [Callorhinchus milii]
MSGGKIFVETLKKIGEPKATHLDGEDFDWLFDSGDKKTFLEWFCKGINEQNVLTTEEVDEFEKLKKSGKSLFDQKALDPILQTYPKESDSKYGDLAEISGEELEEEVKTLQSLRNLKIQRRNKQQLMTSAIHLVPLKDEKDESTKLLIETQEQLSAENAKLNAILLKIIEGVQQLTVLYSNIGSEMKAGQPKVFLSQLLLNNYLQKEEQCTAALTAYTKKQFFEGIVELVESSDVDKFQLVDLSCQTLLEESNEVRREYQQQMTRLQAAYTSGKRQLILAKAKEQSTKAGVQYAEKIFSLIQKRKVNDGEKETQSEGVKCLKEISCQVEQLINKELPDLIVENAQLLNMPVVKGNFDLQVTRQDYYTSKQDEVARQLIRQKTRFELLQLGYEMESRSHRDIHCVLENLTQELERIRNELAQCLKVLSDQCLVQSNRQRNIIDSRDTSAIRLCQILDGDNREQLFRTYDHLEEQGKMLQNEAASLRYQLEKNRSDESYLRSSLESDIERLRCVMYSGPKQLLLHSENLSGSFQKLESQLQKVTQILMDIDSEIKPKRQILESNLHLQHERNLYIHFFQNPDKLKEIVEGLEKEAEANAIGLKS